jgi:hypothetical protein
MAVGKQKIIFSAVSDHKKGKSKRPAKTVKHPVRKR